MKKISDYLQNFLVIAFFLVSKVTFAQIISDPLTEARALVGQHRFDEVVVMLTPFSRKNPSNAEAHYWLAEAFRQLQKPNYFQANFHIQEALDLQPKNSLYWETKIRILTSGDPFFGAKLSQNIRISDISNQLIANDPNNVFANEIRGIHTFELYFEDAHASEKAPKVLRLRAEAWKYLKRAIELGSENESCWEALFKIYLQNQGKYPEMLRYLSQARFMFPTKKAQWDLYQGVASFREKQYDEAAAYLKEYYTQADSNTQKDFDDLHYWGEAAHQMSASAFWHKQDPSYLTSYNERQLEHWARIGYAQLFGFLHTDKAEILIRYGFPVYTYSIGENVPVANLAAMGIVSQSNGDAVNDNTNRNNVAIEGTNLAADCHVNDFDIPLYTPKYWFYPKMYFILATGYLTKEELNIFYSPDTKALCATSFIGLENAKQRDQVIDSDYSIQSKAIFLNSPTQSQILQGITFPYQTLSFKGEHGQNEVFSFAGIPMSKQVKSISQVPDALKTGFYFLDVAKDTLFKQEQSAGFYKQHSKLIELRDNTLLIVGGKQSLSPAMYRISAEFEVGKMKGVMQGERQIPTYQDHTFSMSDVLLAYQIKEGNGSGMIDRHNVSFTPAPWGVFNQDQPIYVYVEAYNISKSDKGDFPYSVEASMIPKESRNRRVLQRGSKKEGVSVQFSNKATQVDDGSYFMMDTIGQARGKYILKITLKDEVTLQTLTKEMDILLE